jgi:DNA ligase (NAD+)
MSSELTTAEFFEKISSLSKEDLLSIDGVGDVIAENLLAYFASEQFIILSSKLDKLNKPLSVNVNDFSLAGEKGVVCITGTFDKSRPELSELLQATGYQVVTAVTKKTTILLAGEDAGSKVEKAQKMKVKIVFDYNELLS